MSGVFVRHALELCTTGLCWSGLAFKKAVLLLLLLQETCKLTITANTRPVLHINQICISSISQTIFKPSRKKFVAETGWDQIML